MHKLTEGVNINPMEKFFNTERTLKTMGFTPFDNHPGVYGYVKKFKTLVTVCEEQIIEFSSVYNTSQIEEIVESCNDSADWLDAAVFKGYVILSDGHEVGVSEQVKRDSMSTIYYVAGLF